MSAHSGQSAAVMTTLEALFGTDIPFVDSAHNADGFASRSFARIFDAAVEAGMSRLYAGIHFACRGIVVREAPGRARGGPGWPV